MNAGTIEWNGTDLSRLGKPKITIRRTPDPAPPGVATRMLVSIGVTMDLEALDPSTILARAEWLALSMHTPEGILKAGGGSGAAVEWLAVPGDTNLAEVLSGLSNRVEMSFSASEKLADGCFTGLPADTFTPAGSSVALALHHVREESREVSTSRHSDRADARSVTTTQISFTARVAMSNPAESFSTRLSYLKSQATAVKSLDARNGVLNLGGDSKIVRVSNFSTSIDDRALLLDVKVQCSYFTLPDSGTAEVMVETESALEEGSGHEIITLSGSIDATSRDIAYAKLDSIRAAQQVSGQSITRLSTHDKVLDGSDTSGVAGADWAGSMSFSITVRKYRPNGRMTLKIDSNKDFRSGMRWNYSGTVTAPSEVDGLALARSVITSATHPIFSRSQETVERSGDISDHTLMNAVKVDFSYEFEGPSDGFVSAEITTEYSQPLAGEWTHTFSGNLVAISAAVAEAKMDSLIASFGLSKALQFSKRLTQFYVDPLGTGVGETLTFTRLDFNASIRAPQRTYAAVEYTDSTENDYTTMTQIREISGSIYSTSRIKATEAFLDFISWMMGAVNPSRTRLAHSEVSYGPDGALDQARGVTEWIKSDFSISHNQTISGETGYDLMEASYTLERTGSIQNTVVTTIPYERPVAQANTGYHPGRFTISASAKAVNLDTAKTWVQACRTKAPAATGRHETDQPVETQAPEYAAMDGATAKCWTFTGRYGWTYVTGLDSTW